MHAETWKTKSYISHLTISVQVRVKHPKCGESNYGVALHITEFLEY